MAAQPPLTDAARARQQAGGSRLVQQRPSSTRSTISRSTTAVSAAASTTAWTPRSTATASRSSRAPDVVTITYEMIHETRVIASTTSPYPAITQFTGNARGYWEGDTLVIESRGFHDRTSVGGAPNSANMARRSAFAASIPRCSSTASRSTIRKRTRRRSRCARCGRRSRTTTRTSTPATKATSRSGGGLAGERAFDATSRRGDRGGQTAAQASAREHLRRPRGRRAGLRHQRRRVAEAGRARAALARTAVNTSVGCAATSCATLRSAVDHARTSPLA